MKSKTKPTHNMMKKINVKICVGTMCYVMGGAELRDVIESLPQNILEHLNISYSPCLECGESEQAPPFIEVNGKRIAGVSKNSLIRNIKEELRDVV